MKKLVLILALCLLGTNSYSQKNLDITFHQDTRFIFFGDNRGNHRGTEDFLIKAEIPIIRFAKSHVIIFPLMEYAGLHAGTYRRFAIGAGHIFYIVPKKVDLGVLVNYGIINRFEENTPSFGLSVEGVFWVSEKFGVSYTHQIIDRRDLWMSYNTTKTMKPSSFIGIKLRF